MKCFTCSKPMALCDCIKPYGIPTKVRELRKLMEQLPPAPTWWDPHGVGKSEKKEK